MTGVQTCALPICKGKAITGIRAQMLEKWLPKLTPQVPARGKMKLKFGIQPKKLVLEVGFGGGEHLAELAKREPDTGFLGAEVFLNGVASLLAHLNGSHRSGVGPLALEVGRVDNIRIWPEDIRLLFDKLPDEIFDEIYVLYPDPWPKKRHADRRFINPDNLKQLARCLKTGGILRIATDHKIYKHWVLHQMHDSPAFRWTATCGNDWKHEPTDWVQTKYQCKALREGRRPVFLDYEKI